MTEDHSIDYEAVVKRVAADHGRTPRERDLERAFGPGRPLPDVLTELRDECRDNRTEMVRRLNDRLNEADGVRDGLSRSTLYNYLKKYDLD